jgi:Raf kinase inhibitor-like YbhB/YbcL family protein
MKFISLLTLLALVLPFAASAQEFKVSSNSIKNGGTIEPDQVYNGFGCNGNNLSPDLSWENPPEGTRSFAITAYDPDAPTGSGWWHWVAFNIPVNARRLNEGDSGKHMPHGTIESRTDFGEKKFGGSCPPEGDKPHRYQYTLWALNTDKLELAPRSSAAMVGYFLNKHKITSLTIEALYGR